MLTSRFENGGGVRALPRRGREDELGVDPVREQVGSLGGEQIHGMAREGDAPQFFSRAASLLGLGWERDDPALGIGPTPLKP